MQTYGLITLLIGALLGAIGAGLSSGHGPRSKRDVLRKYDRREEA